MVACKLCVASRSRKSGLRYELVCLVVQIISDVTSEKAIDEGSLRFVVVT